jgi:hypothetical protein
MRRASDDGAAVRMADEHDIAQVFSFDQCRDVVDVCMQTRFGRRFVRSLRHSGQRRRFYA